MISFVLSSHHFRLLRHYHAVLINPDLHELALRFKKSNSSFVKLAYLAAAEPSEYPPQTGQTQTHSSEPEAASNVVPSAQSESPIQNQSSPLDFIQLNASAKLLDVAVILHPSQQVDIETPSGTCTRHLYSFSSPIPSSSLTLTEIRPN